MAKAFTNIAWAFEGELPLLGHDDLEFFWQSTHHTSATHGVALQYAQMPEDTEPVPGDIIDLLERVWRPTGLEYMVGHPPAGSADDWEGKVALHEAYLEGEDWGVQMDAPGADLSYAVLSECDLTRAGLEGATLSHATIRYARIDTDLTGTTCFCTDFEGSRLHPSLFHAESLAGALLDGCTGIGYGIAHLVRTDGTMRITCLTDGIDFRYWNSTRELTREDILALYTQCTPKSVRLVEAMLANIEEGALRLHSINR